METLKKLVDLPFNTAKGLTLLAAQEGLQTKPFMEKVLIDYEKKENHTRSHNYKLLNPKSNKTSKK